MDMYLRPCLKFALYFHGGGGDNNSDDRGGGAMPAIVFLCWYEAHRVLPAALVRAAVPAERAAGPSPGAPPGRGQDGVRHAARAEQRGTRGRAGLRGELLRLRRAALALGPAEGRRGVGGAGAGSALAGGACSAGAGGAGGEACAPQRGEHVRERGAQSSARLKELLHLEAEGVAAPRG
eukprot:2771346-Rhodomonas_salina.1